MKNDSIKKYLIPNIPYLFILWAFLKLGTAYRLAAGADFAHKLMGLGQTIGPAFADFAPGLAPFDLSLIHIWNTVPLNLFPEECVWILPFTTPTAAIPIVISC